MGAARDAVKRLAWRAGLTGAVARRRLGGSLTVLMFHRVLDRADPRWPGATRQYTLDPQEFALALDVAGSLFTPVSLRDVIEARGGGRPLPRAALLVSFDDGWSDNLHYAAPELARRGWPAVLFAAAGWIGSARPFWQEQWHEALATGRVRRADLAAHLPPELADISVEAALARLDPGPRAALLESLGGGGRPAIPAFLTVAELARLAALGWAVGGHGCSHEPLTAVADGAGEIAAARQALSAMVGAPLDSLSFPHGRWDPALVRAARASGHALCFTSDRLANACPGGRPASDLLGRVEIHAGLLADPDGTLRPERLANFLATLPVGVLEAGEEVMAA